MKKHIPDSSQLVFEVPENVRATVEKIERDAVLTYPDSVSSQHKVVREGLIKALSDRTPVRKGCGKPLAAGQYWTFCGEIDMGQTAPALCETCNGPFKRA